MKTKTMVVTTLALSLMTAAICLAAGTSPHMGAWKLNESKSKLDPAMGKNKMVVYAADGDKIKVTVDGVGKDGKATHSVWVGKFDGKAYPAKGNLAYNQVKYTQVDERTNDIEAMKDGNMIWSGKITVSKDGKTREVTVKGTGADGKKFSGTAVYDKK